ncbi:hypothetical protein F5890DRAFT_1526461 [Lentinula detonsa]|uniref:Secreted protein n=1 Tax=Lentinula detonsa TaxID=2804962 RepID=A0AA38PX68_9AGAR|nr:hypothetical protein F5890DRAFT_1526461 [Lentinula detonsa]
MHTLVTLDIFSWFSGTFVAAVPSSLNPKIYLMARSCPSARSSRLQVLAGLAFNASSSHINLFGWTLASISSMHRIFSPS